MISKWRHPIKYLRLVTTPTCGRCKHFVLGIALSKDRCTCEKYLEHANRHDWCLADDNAHFCPQCGAEVVNDD